MARGYYVHRHFKPAMMSCFHVVLTTVIILSRAQKDEQTAFSLLASMARQCISDSRVAKILAFVPSWETMMNGI